MVPFLYLDNIIFSLQRMGGISVYWYEMTSRMLRDQLPITFIEQLPFQLLRNKQSSSVAGQANLVSLCNNFRRQLNIPSEQIIPEKCWPLNILRYLPIQVSLPAKSVFHGSYYRDCRQNNIAKVITVHDFIYEKFRKGPARWIHIYQKKQSLPKADRIICISQNTKKDLLEYYPKILPERIHVIYQGVSEKFYPIPKENLILNHPSLHSTKLQDISNGHLTPEIQNLIATIPEMQSLIILLQKTSLLRQPYVVFVGERPYYKNFTQAVLSVARIAGLSLIAVGGRPLNSQEKQLIQKFLPNRFVHLTGISVSDLNVVYNLAVAMLYPSSYEGFGLPVVEAMKAGCPVVAIRTSSIPEICQNAGLLVASPTQELLAEKLQSLCEDSKLREELIHAGSIESKQFSWETCYQQTLQVYQQAYSEKF